jgi:hypothetical protein
MLIYVRNQIYRASLAELYIRDIPSHVCVTLGLHRYLPAPLSSYSIIGVELSAAWMGRMGVRELAVLLRPSAIECTCVVMINTSHPCHVLDSR